MKVLCPECQVSIELGGGETALVCTGCGLNIDISKLGTSPGMAHVPVVRDFTGETLGEFKLEELIGIGGMGVVYRATRRSDGSNVAVKILSSEVQWKREAFVARFKREAEALKRLNHPNVVKLIDSGQEGDCYYLVTEFVEGQNLAGYLRSQTLTIGRVVEIMAQVCEAITYAHANGIVHRDIKPANIIVSKDRVKVLDFGLAQITGKDAQLTTLTRTDLAMGTINYLSPEQRLNAKNVDERSDIFSLGIVFFEMLTGTLPIGTFAPPSKFRKDAPKKCNSIVNRSLNTNPDLRYQNVEALRDDLLELLKPATIVRPLAIAALALLAGGLAAWPYLESQSKETFETSEEPVQLMQSTSEVKEPGQEQGFQQINNDLGQVNAPSDLNLEQQQKQEPNQAVISEKVVSKNNESRGKSDKSRAVSAKDQKKEYLERMQKLRDKKNPPKKPQNKSDIMKEPNEKGGEKVSSQLAPEPDGASEAAEEKAAEPVSQSAYQEKSESKKNKVKDKKPVEKRPLDDDDANVLNQYLSPSPSSN